MGFLFYFSLTRAVHVTVDKKKEEKITMKRAYTLYRRNLYICFRFERLVGVIVYSCKRQNSCV